MGLVHRLQAPQQLNPCLGQRKTARMAFKQVDAQLRFEQADLPANGGGRNIQLPRSGPHGTKRRHRHKVAITSGEM